MAINRRRRKFEVDHETPKMVATRRGTDTRSPASKAPATPTTKSPATRSPATKAPAGAGLSTLSAAVNCLNGSVGVGVLGLPTPTPTPTPNLHTPTRNLLTLSLP